MKTRNIISISENHPADRRVRKTKKAIQMAFAQQMLLCDDIGSISVTALCKAADINRKTFYYHYTGVEDVLNEIVSDIVGAYYEDISNWVPDKNDSSGFSRLIVLIDSNIEFYKVLFSADEQHIFFSRLLLSLNQATQQYFCSEKGFDPELVQDVTTFIISGTTASFHVWYSSDYSRDVMKLTQTVSALVSKCLEVLYA